MSGSLIDVRARTEESLTFGTEIVQVLIGKHEKSFQAHSAILQTSKFFEAALKKEWKGGQKNVIRLPEDQPEQFEIYLQWLYTGKIFLGLDPTSSTFPLLARLYGLDEKIVDNEFQDRVLDAFVSELRNGKGKEFCYKL